MLGRLPQQLPRYDGSQCHSDPWDELNPLDVVRLWSKEELVFICSSPGNFPSVVRVWQPTYNAQRTAEPRLAP